jgi:phosphocarrier protein HPr
MPELEEEMTVVNPLGIHARPAAALVQCVVRFKSDIFIAHNGNRVNAKSIMGLLTLAATRGSRIKVQCRGDDAEQAIAAVRAIFAAGFGE